MVTAAAVITARQMTRIVVTLVTTHNNQKLKNALKRQVIKN